MMQLDKITLLYPYALAILPLFLLCQKVCGKKVKSIVFSNFEVLQKLSSKNQTITKLFKYLVIFFISLALASPIIKHKIKPKNTKAYDISLLLDASDSMREDKRFTIAKKVLKEFIAKRENDAIALSVFGDYAFIASPFTTNKEGLNTIIEYLKPGVAGDRATALYEALYLGSNIFKKSKAKKRIVILLTDGINTVKSVSLKDTIKKIKEQNLKVYTISIGKNGDYNAKVLSNIAKSSGGKFYTLNKPQELGNIYNQINKIEKSKISAQNILYLEYLFIYPLMLAMLFMLLFTILSNKNILSINLIILTLILIAILKPSIMSNNAKLPNNKVNFSVALDIGQSMEGKDIYPNRLNFAKNKIKTLMSKLTKQKIALLAFNKYAYLITPYSNNYSNLKYQLKHIDPTHTKRTESKLLNLLKAVEAISKKQERKKLLLLSDFSQLTDTKEAIKYAKKHNIDIFSYIVSTQNGTPIIENNKVIKDKFGNIKIFKANIETIKELRSIGKVKFYSLQNSDLDMFINNLNSNSKKEYIKKYSSIELYFVPLILALLIIFYTDIKRRKLW